MPTQHETILAALGGDVLPERVPTEGLLILRDGKPGEPAVSPSPLRYHYQHRPEIEAIVQGADCSTSFEALIASISAALAADPTPSGLCDRSRRKRRATETCRSRARPA